MMTKRQLEMVKHLANGMKTEEIAVEMHLSKSSVAKTLTKARKVNGAKTLAHLVSITIAAGYLSHTKDEEDVQVTP